MADLATAPVCTILDYGAGNVRSLRNAIHFLGFATRDVACPKDIEDAEMLVFPGVGSFGHTMQALRDMGVTEVLREYVRADRPFLGICLGLQTLFEESDEAPGEAGLGIIPGRIRRFDASLGPVPHMGWNGVSQLAPSPLLEGLRDREDLVYFVHSFRADLDGPAAAEWGLGATTYLGSGFLSALQRGNVCATQFHPEKSGDVGLRLLRNFLARGGRVAPAAAGPPQPRRQPRPTQLARRIVAALDVRTNDEGDLVVTKGESYDVRERDESSGGRGAVRNLGKPVALAQRYYEQGADECVFLNITSFRQGVIDDLPMLQVLERASERCFVPLTVGGGIRAHTDTSGHEFSALDVADRYFRAGADKVSIGSDAVRAAEAFEASGGVVDEQCSIHLISKRYGAQAVVVSIDPRRVYLSEGEEPPPRRHVVALPDGDVGPAGERRCWYQATVKGGREGRDLCAVRLAIAAEALGAGELMVNSITHDGQGRGYDTPLIAAVQAAVGIPVIASSGAGCAQHFVEVFRATGAGAALAAGIFHRGEVEVGEVKAALRGASIACRD